MPDLNGSPRPRWLPNLLLSFLLVTVVGGLITAYLQHRNDQLKALDEQQTAVLQTYINNMRDLLLNHNLNPTLHPIEAYNFISFMSSKPSQIRIAEANHTLPTRQSAYRDNRVSGEHFISEFRAIESTAVPQPNIPQAVHFFETFDPHIAAALDGVESPTTALNAVADAWKQLLASS